MVDMNQAMNFWAQERVREFYKNRGDSDGASRRTKMLRIAAMIGLLATALLAAPAGAQLADLEKIRSTTPEQRAEFLTQTMTSQLTLTEKQVPKVDALNLKYAKLQQPA